MEPVPKTVLDHLYLTDLVSLVVGVLGGAVTLIRTAKRRKNPLSVYQIAGYLITSAFAAWLVSLLLPTTVDENYRIFIYGISGMCGEQLLSLFEETFLKRFSKEIST